MLTIISLLMILIGGLCLLLSLSSVNHISQKDSHIGWRALRILVFLFLFGYCSVFYYLSIKVPIETADFVISSIMMGGGIFVFLVFKLSLKSLMKLEHFAVLEHNNALHDSLTGLPNRKYLMESLNEHIEKTIPFSLMLIDLDRFKQINDALGHKFGDLLLIQVGAKITQILPPNTRLYRLGGDEFSIISDYTKPEEIELLIANISESLAENFTIENYELSIDASIGVTYFPANGHTIETLLNQSDLAMYKSKEQSTSYIEYSPSLETSASENVYIATRLKEAIKQQEFELYYQPIIDLNNSCVYGAEALIRWPQKDGTFIEPDKFIKIAEQSALINQVTSWVMGQIKRDITQLNQANPSLCIHFNLSVKDLQDSSFVNRVGDLLACEELNNHRIMLEVTESAMMTDVDYVRKTMKTISQAGLVFSVDDFGTGYSSLALLRDLPVGQIKIDRSFTKNVLLSKEDRAIVKSTIYLGQNLGCSIVAEGVEDKQTELLLNQIGCDYAQGYFYSPPLNLKAFISYTKAF